MKYTKYDENKKVYIISKNHTSKRESKAEWKEDICIPTTELDTESIIRTIKETGKGTKIIRQHSFIVLHDEKRYIVQFYFSSSFEIVIIINDDMPKNVCFYNTGRDIWESQYLITEEDIGTWEKSKKQVAESFKLIKQ